MRKLLLKQELLIDYDKAQLPTCGNRNCLVL
jgi:hypothetical protein